MGDYSALKRKHFTKAILLPPFNLDLHLYLQYLNFQALRKEFV